MKLRGASYEQMFSWLNVTLMYCWRVQLEITLKRGSFVPTANSINRRNGPGKFLNLSFHLLIWVGTPNDVQGPHFGISETMGSVEGGVTVRPELLSNRIPLIFQNQGKRSL